MRPVNKGNIPQVNGVIKTVADYKDWRQDLLDALGNYCCYCNMALNDSPQVEHVIPKNPQAGQPAGALLAWDNMLLACGPCNRAKDNRPNSAFTHYMPDTANTHLPFEYVVIDHPAKTNQKACIPVPRSAQGVIEQKARDTIDLCKLDALTVNPRATDLRWQYRFETWYCANAIWKKSWDNWGHTRSQAFIGLLLTVATSKGFFSIWFEAFSDVPEVKIALIDAFTGTHRQSFQANPPYNPQFRNPQDAADPV